MVIPTVRLAIRRSIRWRIPWSWLVEEKEWFLILVYFQSSKRFDLGLSRRFAVFGYLRLVVATCGIWPYNPFNSYWTSYPVLIRWTNWCVLSRSSIHPSSSCLSLCPGGDCLCLVVIWTNGPYFRKQIQMKLCLSLSLFYWGHLPFSPKPSSQDNIIEFWTATLPILLLCWFCGQGGRLRNRSRNWRWSCHW